MTIRFSPARHRNALARTFASTANDLVLTDAANDDCFASDDALLAEALRHFAVHGLSAAEQARDQALAAQREGDEDGYDRWLAVCRMFDRRMAALFASQEPFTPD